MFRLMGIAVGLTMMMSAASADVVSVPATGSVKTATDALEKAVKDNGGEVHARIARPARTENESEKTAEVLIFSDPEIENAATQDDPRNALLVPVRVLVYPGDEGTTLIYEEPRDLFSGLQIREDKDYVVKMGGILQLVTNKASIAMD